MHFDTLPWAGRHELARHCLNADQVERLAIETDVAPIGSGIEDDKIAGVIDEDDDVEPGDWNGVEEVAENANGDAQLELERRAELLGDSYPFVLRDGSLSYRGSATGIYEFCLAVTLSPSLKAKPYKSLATTFELLACETAKMYLGDRAQAVRTGWPSHNVVERPVKFKALSKIVEEKSGEWRWKINSIDPDPSHRSVKDEGVDYVVWIPMLDKRGGKVFMLGQCACGDDWDTKLDDINGTALSQYLEPISCAPYTKALSVPRHIPGRYIFEHCNQRAGVTFDRARLCLIAEDHKLRASFVALAATWTLDNLTRLVIPTYAHRERL